MQVSPMAEGGISAGAEQEPQDAIPAEFLLAELDPDPDSTDWKLGRREQGGPQWHRYRRVRAYVAGGVIGVLGPVAFVGIGYMRASNTQWDCAINCVTPGASFAHRVIGDFPIAVAIGILAAIAYVAGVEGLYRTRIARFERGAEVGDDIAPSKLRWAFFIGAVFGLALTVGVLRGVMINHFQR